MQLIELQQEMEVQSNKLEIWKDLFRRRLAGDLQDISKQRAELDRMEEQAEAAMIKEDNNNKSLVGSWLEESVQKILRSYETTEERPEIRPDVKEFGRRILWKDIGVERGTMWSTEKSTPDLPASKMPPRDGILVDERSSGEFSYDDATYETLRLAAESKTPMDV
ncbi:MAG: hypothetical protein Q9187_002613 [Circinaria calcarea]